MMSELGHEQGLDIDERVVLGSNQPEIPCF